MTLFDLHYQLDFLLVGIAIVVSLVLGAVVYLNDRTSRTHFAFLFFCISATLWNLSNFGLSQPQFFPDQLLLLRASIFFAIWYSFSFNQLFTVFPEEKFVFSRHYWYGIVPATIIVAGLTLTPFVFRSIGAYNEDGTIGRVNNGPLLPLFGMMVVFLITHAIFVLAKKTNQSDPTRQKQIRIMAVGAAITFTLHIMFNMVLPAFFENSSFISLGALFSLPFTFFTTYGIVKYRLFNVKVIATEAFVGILSLVYFTNVFLATGTAERIVNVLVLFANVGFGTLLIRSVRDEVRAREKIQGLAKNLSETNWELAKKNEQLRIIDQRKSEFVSIVSHQLRTPITAIKGYSSLLLEETFGKLSETQKPPLDKIFVSSTRLAEMVSDFLDISKIEQGTMAYTFKQVDFGKMVADLVEEFQERAKAKNISLEFKKGEGEPFSVIADEGKVRQVVSNVIDNSIKYTPTGGIVVTMERNQAQGTITCKLKDTGVGLSQDDIHHLFGKFTRGTEGSKINASGSGLGLYVAKKMLEANKGDIWVDSEGVGKGSTFVIALPKEGSEKAPQPGTVTASTTEEGK